ncbi:uncharacterized protein B0H64DRAFT_413517 [Chaetomium fimeti]|uniref:Infection structure specific protein n=1 Tax=Chaetomium fimeti TaxID=1854472 RepID=A0AAE0LM02_9PEZI|nr:hypothetical protein B0H64DRAFT_413517 [Chaetomium fimeti]
MHSFTLLSALAGASLVLAQPLEAPAAAPQITAAPDARLVKPALEHRQENSEECESKAAEIFEDQVGMEISNSVARWLMSKAESIQTLSIGDEGYVSGYCSVAFQTSIDAPAPISSAYVSFLSKSASWVNEVKPTVTSLAQSCGGAVSAGLGLVLATDFDSCTSAYDAYIDAALAADNTSSPGASSTGASPTPSTTAQPTGTTPSDDNIDDAEANDVTDGESTSTSTGGAPRETGFAVAAAAAVVAVAGAMVAL